MKSLTKDEYLYWVKERHSIYTRRRKGQPRPWTEDEFLANRKYCNVFRVLDKESQYSVINLYSDESVSPEDMLMRSLFHRLLIRPEPWEFFYDRVGRYPVIEDLMIGNLDKIWREMYDMNRPMFKAGVYLTTPPRDRKGVVKIEYFLEVIRDAFNDGLMSRFDEAEGAKEKLKAIQMIPRFGPFMSQQVLTDYGYSVHGKDFENDYVEIGPGSIRGLQRLGYDPENEAQEAMQELQALVQGILPGVALRLPDGRFRLPSRMDIQNTLCEVDKYARISANEAPNLQFNPTRGEAALPQEILPRNW